MTAAVIDLQSLARFSSERLLNCGLEGMGIALLAWLLLLALGRQSSSTRFAVWFAALLVIAGAPFFVPFAGRGAGPQSGIALPDSWAFYIFGAWCVIAVFGLARVVLGLSRLEGLRRDCASVDVATLDPLLQATLRQFDTSRRVTLCTSTQVRVPTAIGFFKPMVVMPHWAMRELSAQELNTILLHELAHLRRWDDWTNLAQKIVGALFFFHPAVWWIGEKMALEREMACDDLVLVQAPNRQAYAECLVSLAEKSVLRRGLALAQAAVGRIHSMSLRVAQILDVNRPCTTQVWRPAPALLALASVLTLGVFGAGPRLISFGDSAPGTLAASTTSASARAIPAEDASAANIRFTPARLATSAPEIAAPASGKLSGELPARRLRHDTQPYAVAESAKSSASGVIPAKFAPRKAPGGVQTLALSFGDDDSQAQMLVVETSVVEKQATPAGTSQTQMWQGRVVDSHGATVWRVYVWQVTVSVPASKSGVDAKSI